MNESFEDFMEEDTNNEYHYRFYLEDGSVIDDHGYLLVTPTIAAIGFGKGELRFVVPMSKLHHVTRVDDQQVMNA